MYNFHSIKSILVSHLKFIETLDLFASVKTLFGFPILIFCKEFPYSLNPKRTTHLQISHGTRGNLCLSEYTKNILFPSGKRV